jgi:RNA polymerase primary sigma factor
VRSEKLHPGLEGALLVAASEGDAEARERLVASFMPLIGGIARRYRGAGGIERGELMQEGVVGLLRALERYDVSTGVPFWAYASWWVRQAMQRLVAELTRPVVLSDRALRQLARVRDAHRAHLQDAGAEPSMAELALRTGLPRQQVEILAGLDRVPRRLDEPMQHRDEQAVATFGDTLRDPTAEDQYDRLEEEQEIEDMRRLVATLGERERVVLDARFGLRGPEQTLRQIGHRLELSPERVRQIEAGALGKLRQAACA